MAKLFRHLFKSQVLKAKLNLNEDTAETVSALQSYCTRASSHNPILMYRLPKQELFELSSLACLSDTDEVKAASKALRSFSKIDEKTVCSACTRKCAVRNLPHDSEVSPNTGHVYWLLLGAYQNQELNLPTYSSASILLQITNHL